MRMVIVLLVTLMESVAQEAQPPSCASVDDCRQSALDAAAAERYEDFHTLAWRAVQLGPRNDPGLMFLLARAQSLSGRAHDALVMLRRLAEMGIAVSEAETSDDFRRVRSLAGWTELQAKLRGAPNLSPGASPIGEARLEPGLPKAPTMAAAAAPAGKIANEMAIPASLVRPVALDYDAVSRRFVFADESTETLKIVDQLSGKAVNLVSRGWSGEFRTTALIIDPRRGDLWVAGIDNANDDVRSALHRVQLVSGRLLYSVPFPADTAIRVTDLAMVGDTTLCLDRQGRRIYELTPGSKTFRLRAQLPTDIDPLSLAPADDAIVYVAHVEGVRRLNLIDRSGAPLKAAGTINLQGLQWLRAHKGSLIGIQSRADGRHAAIRIRLDGRGRTATGLEVLGAAASRAAALAGKDFYYLAETPAGTGVTLRKIELD
jgi:hypothetical protein